MTAIDKAAIAWTIAIVVVGVGIASMHDQFQASSTPQATSPVVKTEPAATTKSILEKASMPGWDRVESIQDPGIGHETHQLAVILPPSDKVYSGTITYDASEPIQLVTLIGPIPEGELAGQPTWTTDGKTKYALVLADPKKSAGSWVFSGNALAIHTMNKDPFTVSYAIVLND